MKNQEKWNSYVEKNTDAYGGACVKVANRVMELLDEDKTPLHNGFYPDIHTANGLICKAADESKAGGITGFTAGCVAQMVAECHERGDEFRKSHNGEEYQGKGIVNQALLTFQYKEFQIVSYRVKPIFNFLKQEHG